jgi:hypothetical protein
MRNYFFGLICFLLAALFLAKLLNIEAVNNLIETLDHNPGILSALLLILGVGYLFNSKSIKIEHIEKNELSDPSKKKPAGIDEGETILNFICLLQEKGRLLDFLKDDIGVHSDEDVGKVARIVHQGLKEVIESTFSIEPIHAGNEGELVQFSDSVNFTTHKFLGNGTKKPPFSGTVVHKGWQAKNVLVPKTNNQKLINGELVIQPVEIEVR